MKTIEQQQHIMNGIAFTAIVLLVAIAMVILFYTGAAHAANIGQPAPVPAPAAAPAGPADEDPSRLAEDFAAATAMACAPTSTTDPSPIDPLACTCNRFVTEALPSIKVNDGDVKGVVSAAERLRIIKIRAGQSTFKTQFQAACGGLLMSIRDDALSLLGFVKLIK
jgi:hypothetical protein